ncbi:hypothetical protein F0L68_32085 [Solihabitans fulvus]|uniref:Phosphoinositide phospholipase C, Ca2+-dependent n=1 Tax=Solihabitans fulvus TaxID=1892852 RepID=A0A5B2WQ96_9PSEU|nr:phosphatidylinositol-specific phospholipase C domain-containing protein [Solihabitans fulvus]KAA2253911.1 hypothetical protein F0L68_32085 [Solihabitans fulvus]
MAIHRLRRAGVLGSALALAALATMSAAGPAGATTATAPLSQVTGTGVHNTYNPADYGYLAQALDTGTSMIELDAWTDVITGEWKVSHSNPFGNANNCVDAAGPADLYRGSANKDLGSCLDDVRIWLAAHPSAGPVYLKVELKNGFEANLGMGPAEFDAVLSAHLGGALFRPADLMAGRYPSPDAAARANAWPTRSALAGRALAYVIPGTVELANPFDTLHTDVEYSRYLRDLAAAGRIGQATAFPAVLGAATGDPRTQYSDASLRPWFVFFDGDAASYVKQGGTDWYDINHYILVMTDAHNVPPTLNDTAPPIPQAQARVAQLAAAHASVVSSDWYALPAVLSEVLPRG